VRIATARKEEDPIATILAKQNGQPAPSGYKSPDSARKKAVNLLKSRYGWDDQTADDLLGSGSGSTDPLGLR